MKTLKNTKATAAAFLFVLYGVSLNGAEGGLKPLPKVQAQIRNVVAPDGDTKDSLRKYSSPVRNTIAAYSLVDMVEASGAKQLGADREAARHETIRQLAYSAGHVDKEEWGLRCVVMMKRYLHVRADEVVNALVPHLNASDPKTKEGVTWFLRFYFKGYPDRELGLEELRWWIRDHGVQHPVFRRLVNLVYQWTSGLQGITLLLDALQVEEETREELLWEAHLVETAVWEERHGFWERSIVKKSALGALRDLSKHKEWWVRLYVVHVIRERRKESAFRQCVPGVVSELSTDEDATVRQAAVSLKRER